MEIRIKFSVFWRVLSFWVFHGNQVDAPPDRIYLLCENDRTNSIKTSFPIRHVKSNKFHFTKYLIKTNKILHSSSYPIPFVFGVASNKYSVDQIFNFQQNVYLSTFYYFWRKTNIKLYLCTDHISNIRNVSKLIITI